MVIHKHLYRLLIILLLLIVLALLFWGHIQKAPDPHDCRFVTSVDSPDKEYRVNAYLYEPALSADCLVCEVESIESNGNDLKRILYYEYHQDEAKIEWISNESVRINGRELNIFHDEYNWRKDPYESGNSFQLKPIAFYEMEQVVPCKAVTIWGDQRLSFNWKNDKYVELKPKWLYGNNDIVTGIDKRKLVCENAKLNCCFEKETPAEADTFYYGLYTLFEIPSASGVTLLTDGMICYCREDELESTEAYYEDLNNYGKYKVYFQSEDGDEKEYWIEKTNLMREKMEALKRVDQPACTELEYGDEYSIETTSKDRNYHIEIELLHYHGDWYIEKGTSNEETAYYEKLNDDVAKFFESNL